MKRLPFLFIIAASVGCGSPGPVSIPESAELKKLSPGTHHQKADIADVGTVNYTIEIPSSYDGKTPVPLVLALHYGYDGAKPAPYTGEGMIDAFGSGLSELNAIIIAPDALGGRWTGAQNEKAAIWLTNSAMKTYLIDNKKVVITGFSLGGEGTWFIGSRHQELFTGAIPVAAPVAGGDTAWKIPVYVIHSDKDQVVSYNSAKKHAEALKAKGTQMEFKTANGLSHFNTSAYGAHVKDAVKWLQAQWK
jgi:predicted peptidase